MKYIAFLIISLLFSHHAISTIDDDQTNRYILCMLPEKHISSLDELSSSGHSIVCIIQPQTANTETNHKILAYIQISQNNQMLEATNPTSEYQEIDGHVYTVRLSEDNNNYVASYAPHNHQTQHSNENNIHIEIQEENVPDAINKNQIRHALKTFFTVSGGANIPSTPIIMNTLDKSNALDAINQLNHDLHEMKEENEELHKKIDTPKNIDSSSVSVRFIKKMVSYYVKNWHFSPVAFGFASVIEVLLDKSLRNSIIHYEYEPTGSISSNCYVDILANTQELLDDATNQGLLKERHDISTTKATDIIKDLTQTHSSSKIFKSTGLFIQMKSKCECQYCQESKERAKHNLREKRINVILKTDQLRRDIEALLEYDLSKRLHAKVLISGYFYKIDTPNNNNTTTPSCQNCPKSMTESSQTAEVIVVNTLTYTIGIISLPIFALVYYKIKKCIKS